MYIVIIAWLYVILMMSLTMSAVLEGIAFFGIVGLAPAVLYAWLVLRRHRARRAAEAAAHPAATPEQASASADVSAQAGSEPPR